MKPVYNTPLPVGWREKQLKKVTIRRRGYSWDKTQETVVPGDDSTPVIRIPNIHETLNLSDLLYLRNISQEALKISAVTKDWVLFVGSNGNPERIGDSVLISEDRPMVFASFIQGIAIKNPTEILPEFFAQWMRLHNVHQSFSKSSQQTTGLANFSWSAVKRLPFRYPIDMEEQRRIISALTNVQDAIIATQQQHIDASQLKIALMQQLFTKGIPGRHRQFKGSKLLSMPKSWAIKQLHELADVSSGFTMGRDLSNHKTAIVPYVTVINVQDGFLNLGNIGSVQIKESELETGLLKPNDVLMTEGGDRDKLGRGAIWTGQIDPCAYQNHIFRVRFRSDEYLPKLFHHLIQNWQTKRYFFSHAKQTNNLCTINSRELKKYPLGIPDPDEQQEIVEILDGCENTLEAITMKAESLLRLKKSLLQNLLTGNVRINTEAKV